jgi:Chromatin assembly factor 1 subunit A
MSARVWARLRALLAEQAAYGAATLRVPEADATADVESRVAAALQGMPARGRNVREALGVGDSAAPGGGDRPDDAEGDAGHTFLDADVIIVDGEDSNAGEDADSDIVEAVTSPSTNPPLPKKLNEGKGKDEGVMGFDDDGPPHVAALCATLDKIFGWRDVLPVHKPASNRYVSAMNDAIDATDENGEQSEEGVVSVAFYGLQPEGDDDLHDWAYNRLCDGMGTTSDSASASEPYNILSARDGVFEAEVTMLDQDYNSAIVAVRKTMRALRECIDSCVKLAAAMDGKAVQQTSAPTVATTSSGKKAARTPRKSAKPTTERIDKMKIALEKFVGAAAKAREKSDAASEFALKKASRTRERKAKDAEKQAKVDQKEAAEKKKEFLEKKQAKQKKAQASFMANFVKRVALNPSPPAATASMPGAVSAMAIASSLVTVAAARSSPAELVAADGALSAAAAAVAASIPVSHSSICSAEDRDTHEAVLKNSPTCVVKGGMPVLSNPEFAPVSRWLQYLVPFSSIEQIDIACAPPPDPVAGTIHGLTCLLSHARSRRGAAERRLPGVLRDHRRTRSEHRHDLAPRFAPRRAEIRGRSDEDYSCAPFKLLQFDKELRPPYVGTMRRRSATVNPRRPFAKDRELDYDVDSEEEWEDEEEGENLSDDEKEAELEEAELKTLGMFGSDSESDDDDFLDDQDREMIYSDDEEDDDDEQNEDCSSTPVKVFRLRPDSELLGPKKRTQKRRRVSLKIRAPRISVVGPLFDSSAVDPVLDQYAVVRHAGKIGIMPVNFEAEIASSDKTACANGASASGACVGTSNGADCDARDVGSKPTAKRQKTTLSSDNCDLLARAIVRNKNRGKDAICDAFMAGLREGDCQLPAKAAVQRTIDILAQREDKTVAWTLRDPALAERLGLTDDFLSLTTTENKTGTPHRFMSTPTTPVIGGKAATETDNMEVAMEVDIEGDPQEVRVLVNGQGCLRHDTNSIGSSL